MAVVVIVAMLVMMHMVMLPMAAGAALTVMMAGLALALQVNHRVRLDLPGRVHHGLGQAGKVRFLRRQGYGLAHIIHPRMLHSRQLRQCGLQLRRAVGTVNLDGPGFLHAASLL